MFFYQYCNRPRFQAQRKFAQGCIPFKHSGKYDDDKNTIPVKKKKKYDSSEENNNNSFGRKRSASVDGRRTCNNVVNNSLDQLQRSQLHESPLTVGLNLFRTHSNGSYEGVHSLTSINQFRTSSVLKVKGFNEVEGDNVQLYPSATNKYPLYRPPVEDYPLLPVRPKTEDFIAFLCLRGKSIYVN